MILKNKHIKCRRCGHYIYNLKEQVKCKNCKEKYCYGGTHTNYFYEKNLTVIRTVILQDWIND